MTGRRQDRERASFARGCRGFTFAELLAAMLFMAIVLPVAIHALTVASRAGTVADRKRAAAQLADRLLNEMVVTGDWRDADPEGDFGEEWPEYRWMLENEVWTEDTMREISVTVLFKVQEREYRVSLSTLAEEAEL